MTKIFRQSARTASVIVALTFCCCAASAQEPSQSESSAARPSVAIPFYPDTPQGLEKLMKDMMKAEKGGHHDEVATYAKSLELPDADNWFKSVFGEKIGPAVAVASERARGEVEMSAPDLMSRMLREKLTEVKAVSFEEECNPLASDAEFAFLSLRKKPEALYDVRFHDSSRQLIWSYFAYADGGFRFIGNIELSMAGANYKAGESHLPASLQGPPGSVRRIRVGGNVQAGNLLQSCQVLPRYPDDAKHNGVQGTVILHAVIGTEGACGALDGGRQEMEVSTDTFQWRAGRG